MVQKALAIAVVLFFVALGVVVGLRMDDRTVSMLGGVAIGLIIGVPCALMGMQAMRGRETPTRYAEPPPMQELPSAPPATTVTNYNYYDQRKIVVQSPQRSAPGSEARRRAQEMIDAAK